VGHAKRLGRDMTLYAPSAAPGPIPTPVPEADVQLDAYIAAAERKTGISAHRPVTGSRFLEAFGGQLNCTKKEHQVQQGIAVRQLWDCEYDIRLNVMM